MSRVEVCSLAYEGKFKELKEKIDLKPSLATKVDEVRISYVCFELLHVYVSSMHVPAH